MSSCLLKTLPLPEKRSAHLRSVRQVCACVCIFSMFAASRIFRHVQEQACSPAYIQIEKAERNATASKVTMRLRFNFGFAKLSMRI